LPNSSQWMALGASVVILVGVAWASNSGSIPASASVRTTDGVRYNTEFPSDQGALAPCAVCHRTDADGPERSAPSLWGIVGAKTARSPWFGYSPALSAKHGTWSVAAIDAYIADPVAYLPGTTKTLSQVRDADQRRRIIDALQQRSAR
jgi:cytochrome c2